MPKWVWWVILLVVAVMIWRGQGPLLGHGIARMVNGVFAALTAA